MEIMVVDIGSNTIKYDIFSPPSVKSIAHRSVAAGIIRYIENGVLSKRGFDTLTDILLAYQAEAAALNIPLYAFATASLRRVSDPELVIDAVFMRTGIKIDLVSGETESRLSLSGMLSTTEHEKTGLMMDMGGGSTELNVFSQDRSVFSVSCPFGALSLKNEFVADMFPTEAEAAAIGAYAKSVFSAYKENIQYNTLYMVGGSAKAVAKLLFHEKEQSCSFDNCFFTSRELTALVQSLIPLSATHEALLRKMFPDRYQVMLPAAITYVALLEVCGADSVKVSAAGVREGYLLHKIAKEGHTV